jgi:dTDP-D-glucose 4,6-dehydratase
LGNDGGPELARVFFLAPCRKRIRKVAGFVDAEMTLSPRYLGRGSRISAQRLRLDLTVNILTNHAINNGKITVFGGTQMRPNIHIADMVELYLKTLEWPADAIDGRVFNAGYENRRVMDIARMAQTVIGDGVEIVVTPTNDNRSYHVSSEKIRRELGFAARSTIEDAIRDLKAAFDAGSVPNSMTDKRYYNIKTMQAARLV